ncbi:MerR family transcriptional regulator [Enterococcus sp. AZ109]|uniref:MerR family transcriptional regulator n=1 Tax=Enterococcus sp. AZ109 TaxID=2774634 RepID=UPI003F2804FF
MNIKEASQKLGLSADTIRYYEKVGMIPPVNRRNNGIRDFTEADLCWLTFAKEMRSSGLSIEASIKYIQLFNTGGDDTITQRKEILLEQRQLMQEKMQELEASIHALDLRVTNIEALESTSTDDLLAG